MNWLGFVKGSSVLGRKRAPASWNGRLSSTTKRSMHFNTSEPARQTHKMSFSGLPHKGHHETLNANLRLPLMANEPMKTFAPGSPERKLLREALEKMKSEAPYAVPTIIDGNPIYTKKTAKQVICHDHAKTLCEYSETNSELTKQAVEGALKAKSAWEGLGFYGRCAVFLKAADLLSTKYRYEMMAATMLGQSKTAWQAEIDAVCELADFFRLNCAFAEKIYDEQPTLHGPGTWNKVEYRALEGFVLAISPFNFTAIGGNLPCSPALMGTRVKAMRCIAASNDTVVPMSVFLGNVVLWKPSSSSIYSNYLIMKILMEAGLPPGVIQFVPGPHVSIVQTALDSRHFSGLHFTGSTQVFRSLWKRIASQLDIYKSYPRIVGETGGKNMHFVHASADADNMIGQTIRSAFENQGQKCSAASRLYVPESLWIGQDVVSKLVAEMATLKVGPVDEFENFMGALINQSAFDKVTGYISQAKQAGREEIQLLAGGQYDASVGYYVHPTLLLAKSAPSPHTADESWTDHHPLAHNKWLAEEIFGPVLSVVVYPDAEYENYLRLADATSKYGLTGAIFARDRAAIQTAQRILYQSAGNFYINDKCTGAVVGQQAFGGARLSGTNDKAGSVWNLVRWCSPRAIKEALSGLSSSTGRAYSYPCHEKD